MQWSFIPYIFRRVCALQTLVHDIVGQPWYRLLQPVALRRWPSVVIFILLQHRPSRLIAPQYGYSISSSASHLVNIPVSAFSRGLSMILWFNPNLESFGHHLGRYAQSASPGSCLNWLSWCHSVTVFHDAIQWLSLMMPFGTLFGKFGDYFRSCLEQLR